MSWYELSAAAAVRWGASLMPAQGTPLHVVSEVLGHASIAITKDVYGYLVEGDKQVAAEAMSATPFGCGRVVDGVSVPGPPAECWLPFGSQCRRRRRPAADTTKALACVFAGQGLVVAVSTSAPGGTRTPNLLIRICVR